MSKVLQDVTQEVIQYTQRLYYFPEDVKILKVEILTDDWNSRFLYTEYEMNGEKHNITEYYIYSLESAIITVLEKIKDYYTKLRMLQM